MMASNREVVIFATSAHPGQPDESDHNIHGAAITYHQLGRIAQDQRDFETARAWYLKSLAIAEQQDNLHLAAMTYGQLGILAGQLGSMEDCGRWLTRSISVLRQVRDEHAAERGIRNFFVFHEHASPEDKQTLEAIWRETALGPSPTELED